MKNGGAPPAKLDRIVFRIIDSDAQIDALANGEIDRMDIGPDASTYERARNISGVEVGPRADPISGTLRSTGPARTCRTILNHRVETIDSRSELNAVEFFDAVNDLETCSGLPARTEYVMYHLDL